jgi:hypothetical protein
MSALRFFFEIKSAPISQINQNLPRQSVGATCGRPQTNGLRLLGRANTVRPYEILRCLEHTDQSKFAPQAGKQKTTERESVVM